MSLTTTQLSQHLADCLLTIDEIAALDGTTPAQLIEALKILAREAPLAVSGARASTMGTMALNKRQNDALKGA